LCRMSSLSSSLGAAEGDGSGSQRRRAPVAGHPPTE
jgi:hypothetical protein